MLDFELYSIYTEDDEWRGSDKEFFCSYNDAYNARMKYGNWYRPLGDIWIKHYDKTGCHCLEEWAINVDGSIRKHFGCGNI